MPTKLIQRGLFAAAAAGLAAVAVFANHDQQRVEIIDAGRSRTVTTNARTVGELLRGEKIVLDAYDRCEPSLNAALPSEKSVRITRIRVDQVAETTSIPHPVRHSYDADLRAGIRKIVVPGKDGVRTTKYQDTYKDGQRVRRKVVATRSVAPRTAVVKVGLRGMQLASRGAVPHRRVISMVATGYGPTENGRWGNRTATGTRVGYGSVAVDPRVIPLGTKLYVEGYGYAVARDTGRAIKGRRIDLGFGSASEARKVGRRPVRVLILR